jgi:hypothetical protein
VSLIRLVMFTRMYISMWWELIEARGHICYWYSGHWHTAISYDLYPIRYIQFRGRPTRCGFKFSIGTKIDCILRVRAAPTGHAWIPGVFWRRKLLSRYSRAHGPQTYADCCLARRQLIRTVRYPCVYIHKGWHPTSIACRGQFFTILSFTLAVYKL